MEGWQSNGSSQRSAFRGRAVKSCSAIIAQRPRHSCDDARGAVTKLTHARTDRMPARLTCRSRMVNEDYSSTRRSPRSKQARDKLSQCESISRALMHRDAAKFWRAFRLSTRVPEALSSTRIGIEPAISWRRSRAGPRRCSRSSDDTDSRARCDRAARSPPVVCRSHISAWADIDVCRAVDIHVGRPVHNVGVPVHDIRLPTRHAGVSARDIRSCADDAGRSADASLCAGNVCSSARASATALGNELDERVVGLDRGRRRPQWCRRK